MARSREGPALNKNSRADVTGHQAWASFAEVGNFSLWAGEIDASAMGIQKKWARAQWETSQAAETDPAALGPVFFPERQQFFSSVTDFTELAKGYIINITKTWGKKNNNKAKGTI